MTCERAIGVDIIFLKLQKNKINSIQLRKLQKKSSLVEETRGS